MKSLCNRSMSFNECELAILRSSVDKAEKSKNKTNANSPEIKNIISIVEKFIKKKGLMCYGGTAINNILPKQYQFYDKEVEIPDYDFFSCNALADAKELTDEYVDAGFVETEAKSGVHYGTFKVFVNFIPVADITSIPQELFNSLKKEAIRVAGIYYAPANYLRMLMYLELSRPAGDVSRWEKVLKRLTLLNKSYPLTSKQCSYKDFQRQMDNKKNVDKIYDTVKSTLVDQGVIFFGGYAISLYARYMPSHLQGKLAKIPDFDVLSIEPEKTAELVKDRLEDEGVKKVKIVMHPALGDILAEHYEVKVGKDTVLIIYKPLACHSYNIINQDGYDIKIATIDTMLSFYLAFLYANRDYLANKDRILCMSHYLFEVQEKNRLSQKGLLKRFSISCFGHQLTLEGMRSEKARKFKELRDKKTSKEYEEWFLRYRPADKKNKGVEDVKDLEKDATNLEVDLEVDLEDAKNLEVDATNLEDSNKSNKSKKSKKSKKVNKVKTAKKAKKINKSKKEPIIEEIEVVVVKKGKGNQKSKGSKRKTKKQKHKGFFHKFLD